MMVMKCFLSGSHSYFRQALLYLLTKESIGKTCLTIEWKYCRKISIWTRYSPLNCRYQHIIVISEYFIVSTFFFNQSDFFIQRLSLSMGFSLSIHAKEAISSIICLKQAYLGFRLANSFKNTSLNLMKSIMESKVPYLASSSSLGRVSLVIRQGSSMRQALQSLQISEKRAMALNSAPSLSIFCAKYMKKAQYLQRNQGREQVLSRSNLLIFSIFCLIILLLLSSIHNTPKEMIIKGDWCWIVRVNGVDLK